VRYKILVKHYKITVVKVFERSMTELGFNIALIESDVGDKCCLAYSALDLLPDLEVRVDGDILAKELNTIDCIF
jgi:hypothetical protein